MTQIFKYPVVTNGVTRLYIPEGAKIITAALQSGDLFIWAIVNNDNVLKRKTIISVGTGNPIPAGRLNFIDTIFYGQYVWHLFEVPEDQLTEQDITDDIIRAAVGTHEQDDKIRKHMGSYFTRFPSYKPKFTELEWYHIFLDFYESL